MRDASDNKNIKLIFNKTMKCWRVGAPVQVVEYSLYYDYGYNRNFLNCLFINVSKSTVKSIYVDLVCFDDAKDNIGKLENLPLTNVNALPEKHFGSDTDLIVEYLNTSEVEIVLSKVVFEDGTVWRSEGSFETVEIPEQKAIDTEWELYPQLLRECEQIGVTPVYHPVFTKHLWCCTCSTVNENSASSCHDCSIDRSWLEEHFSQQYLAKQNSLYNDALRAQVLARRYEDAKVKHKTYSGYIDAAEKMEALGFYMDAPSLAKSYYAEAARIQAESENRIKEEIYQSKKQLKNSSPDELRSAAAKLDEIAGYKDAAKLAEQYRARAYAIERNERRLEKQQRTLKKKEEERKKRQRKKIIKISLICAVIALIVASLIGIAVWVIAPGVNGNKLEKQYDEAMTCVENGEFTKAIRILETLGTYNNSDKKIEIISESVAGFKDAEFATSDEYPCYSISETGVLSFNKSGFKFNDGEVLIPDVLDDVLVKSFDSNFLKDCDWVVKVDIPYNVKNISEAAFGGCTSLTTVNLHDDIRTIGKSAFAGCTSLKEIIIPEYVTSLGAYAFSNCTAISELVIPSKITVIEEYTFNKCTSLKKITLEGSVKDIGNYAFSYCSSLESITLTKKLHNIGAYAFVYCTSLKDIVIPDEVSSIANNAFGGCSSLEAVVLGSGVKTVGNYVFENCSKLQSVTIGSSVEKIGYSVFSGCSSLSKVIYKGSSEDWSKVTIGDKNDELVNANVSFE